MTQSEFKKILIATLESKSITFVNNAIDSTLVVDNSKVTFKFVTETDVHVKADRWITTYILSMYDNPQDLVNAILTKTKVITYTF
jgi:hypothetical protein